MVTRRSRPSDISDMISRQFVGYLHKYLHTLVQISMFSMRHHIFEEKSVHAEI